MVDDSLHFVYGEQEIAYLKSRDKRLGEAMDRIGPLERAVDTDLFASLVRHIVGQQISTVAQATIWRRMTDALGNVDADVISRMPVDELQRFGITFKKAAYIRKFAEKVACGDFDIDALYHKSDAEVVAELSALNGVGVWTAEMLMTFCMQRPDILSYGDLAIHRGMRMLYRHRKIDKPLFEKYRRRYSPCGTTASMYLWAIAGGAITGLTDPAPRKKVSK